MNTRLELHKFYISVTLTFMFGKGVKHTSTSDVQNPTPVMIHSPLASY